jgi:hypothetical protein
MISSLFIHPTRSNILLTIKKEAFMKTKLVSGMFTMLSALTLIFALSASAADINGRWIAQVTSPSGSPGGDRIFTFKAAGDTVTGTILNQQTVNATFEVAGQPKMTGKLTTQTGNPTEISDGKITGNEISFVTVTKMGQMEMKTTYKGTISGNEIKFTAEMPMPAGMPVMSGPGSAQGSSSSSAQGAQPTTRTQEMAAKRMN